MNSPKSNTEKKATSKSSNSTKISLWQEVFSFDSLIQDLEALSLADGVLNELAKSLLFKRSFEEYQIEIKQTPELKESLIDNFKKSLSISNNEQFELFLQKTNLDSEGLINKLILQEKITRLKMFIAPPEAVNEAFIQNKSKLDAVSFALIRLNDETLAKEVYVKLKDKNEDFHDLAKRFSVGEEASNGGLYRPTPLNNLNPEIKNRLESLKEGEFTEVFSINPSQYIIAKLVQKHPAVLTPQLANNIKNDLFEGWINRQINSSQVKLIIE